jgi:DNA-binding CsgD family transcriptional regulator
MYHAFARCTERRFIAGMGDMAAARGARGLVERGEAALPWLEEAVAVAERSPSVLAQAEVLVEHGAALRRLGQRAAADEPLRRSLELAARSGAHGIELRARDELRAAGRRPRRTALHGVDALTPAERRVVDLAAGGMSNREIAQALFVTVKAVEKHLANAYPKLSIRSRRELPGALGRTAP